MLFTTIMNISVLQKGKMPERKIGGLSLGTPSEKLVIGEDVQNLSIEDKKVYRDPLRLDEGTIWFDEYSFSNGFHYRQITGLPSTQKHDVAVDIGTPWLTTEEGHNFRTLLRVMSAGMPARLIGPPRIWADGRLPHHRFINTIDDAKNVELLHDAYAFLTILDAHDQDGSWKYAIEPGNSLYYGESRGAMIGFGIIALSKLFEREVHLSELVDPCLATETSLKELLTPANIEKGLAEVGSLVKLICTIARENRRRHYRQTFDPSLDYVIPALTTWGALSSGQAGQMASGIPDSTVAGVTFFNASVANQETYYRDILKDKTLIEYFTGDGGHLGLALRTSLFRSIGRMLVAQDQIQNEGTVHDHQTLWAAQPLAA